MGGASSHKLLHLPLHAGELQRDPTGLGEAVVVQPAAGMAGDDAALAVMPVERIAGIESVEVGRLAITREALQHLLLTYGHALHRFSSHLACASRSSWRNRARTVKLTWAPFTCSRNCSASMASSTAFSKLLIAPPPAPGGCAA